MPHAPIPLIVGHFTEAGKVNNKSLRKLYTCNHCTDNPALVLQHRDNVLLEHLTDPKKCPNAPAEVRKAAAQAIQGKKQKVNPNGVNEPVLQDRHTETSDTLAKATESESDAGPSKKRRGGTIHSWVDHALTPEQQNSADIKFFRFIVHSNSPFSASENLYFHEFINSIRPSYMPPSRYVLSHTIMASEKARVHLEDLDRIQEWMSLTLLFDGWEDVLRRNIYGTVGAGVGKYPIVMSLDDMTGKRGTAENYLATIKGAMQGMGIEKGIQVLALTTDNPTVMQSFRRMFQNEFQWVLTLPCFLHGLNTIIGKILNYAPMKRVITASARIVSFFNSSHYWGGQLKTQAESQNIHRSLKTNTESRWYALILQCLSLQDHREPLGRLCLRTDAQRKIGGLSPVPQDIITIALADPDYWSRLNQLIKTCKPITDAIGNVESRDCNLADCMLELIRCAREMRRIEFTEGEDLGFWAHAKSVFNAEFHAMNTGLHSIALFLHPLCRKLAVSQAAKSRTFGDMCRVALDIARRWGWSAEVAMKLIDDLKQYHLCKGLFVGGLADAKEWWDGLPTTGTKNPLKLFATLILSIVPHAAEVERLFSNLGGIQGVKRCNLTIDNFKTLGKLRNNYSYHLQQHNKQLGKTTQRKHGHMHTRAQPGINVDLATDLTTNFTWTPPIAATPAVGTNDNLLGPESITPDELDEAFGALEDGPANSEVDGGEILQGNVYDLTELDKVDKGMAPSGFQDDIQQLGTGSGAGTWSVDALLASRGVSDI